MPLSPPEATAPQERPQSRLEHALQNAALLFANGQSDDAASKLQALYQEDAIAAEDAALLANTLFDLYRTIGAAAPFDALALAEQAGSSKAVNIVLMGHLSRYFDFTEEEWMEAIQQSVPAKFLELNKTAFRLGRNA